MNGTGPGPGTGAGPPWCLGKNGTTMGLKTWENTENQEIYPMENHGNIIQKKRKKKNIGTSHGNYIWDEFPMIFPWKNHWKLTIYGKLSRYGNPWKSSQKYGGVFWEGTSSLSKWKISQVWLQDFTEILDYTHCPLPDYWRTATIASNII